MDQKAIETALRQLEAEERKLDQEAAGLEQELRKKRTLLESLRAGIAGLRGVLQENRDPSPVQTPVIEAASPVVVTLETVPVPGPRKRYRSTKFVADLLAGEKRIWTFEEIVAAFDKEGASAGMQNAEGAIRTALARASLKSYIVALDENRFHAVDYTPPEGSDHG